MGWRGTEGGGAGRFREKGVCARLCVCIHVCVCWEKGFILETSSFKFQLHTGKDLQARREVQCGEQVCGP